MNFTFTPEQIFQSAQGNASALCLMAVVYIREYALSMDEYWAFVGADSPQTEGKE